MKVWFKRSVVGAVALFIVALLGLAIFLLTFDPNSYKNQLQELVSERYQRNLQINGDISLSLFPRIGLSVKEVSLSNRDSASVFASIEQARVAVAIWPLLSNHLVVDHVQINGFRAWVTRSAKGVFNFQDLIDEPEEDAPAKSTVATSVPEPPAPQSAQLNIDIAGLELKDGEVHFEDALTGNSGKVTGVQLNTGRVTFDQPFDVSLRGQLIAAKPVADARFQGQALVRLDSKQNSFSAQKLNVQVNGQLAALKAQSITLQGNLAYSATHRLLDARGLSLEVRGTTTGAEPVDNLSATLTAPQLMVDPGRAQLEVQRLSLRASGKTKNDAFDVAFDAPSLSVSPDKARGDTVSGTVKVSGASVLGLAVELSGLGGNARQLTLNQLKIDGTFKQPDQLTRINLASPVRWDAEASELGFTAIKGDVKIDAPTLGSSGFAFPLIGSLLVNVQKQWVSSDLNAVLNGSPLSFSTRVSGFDNPAIRLNLQAEELDFDKLLPSAAKVASSASEAAGEAKAAAVAGKPASNGGKSPVQASQPAKSDTVLDLKVLDNINLVANARVGRLVARGLAASDMVLDVKAEKGRLDISQLAAKLYGGSLSGKASATSKNAFGAQMNLAGVSVGPVMAAMTGHDRLTGVGSVKLNLNAQSASVDGLLASLGGTVQIALRDGAVKGFNLQQTVTEIADVLGKISKGQVSDIGAKYDLSRETRFASLDANLGFVKGVGTISKLAVDAPLLRVTQGSPAMVNLANQTLDVIANVKVVNPPRGQGGPDLGRLKGITIPVRVHGPFAAMDYGVDVKALIAGSARQVIEQGLKDAIQQKIAPDSGSSTKTADPVKDLGKSLKGLIGR